MKDRIQFENAPRAETLTIRDVFFGVMKRKSECSAMMSIVGF